MGVLVKESVGDINPFHTEDWKSDCNRRSQTVKPHHQNQTTFKMEQLPPLQREESPLYQREDQSLFQREILRSIHQKFQTIE